MEATVKWFNPEKGFGFVALSDGSGDAFMHVATLEAAGHSSVSEGDKVVVQIGIGQKGRQVTAVQSVEKGTGAPPPRTSGGGQGFQGGRSSRTANGPAVTLEGSVKWYNADKGFGFASVDDGDRDVFVHASVVERSGLSRLDEGQRLEMKVVTTPKGREAIAITLK